MSYKGYEVPLAIGSMGLQTDGPQSQLQPNAAVTANNVSFFDGTVSKSPGTARYNSTALSAPIVAAYDWWPTANTTNPQIIALTSDGKVWQDTGDGKFSSNTPLKINETQEITFSSPVTSGFVWWSWNGTQATTVNYGGTDTAAQVQTAMQTIPGLSNVVVTGDWSQGFTVTFPNTNSVQPLITTGVNGMLGTGNGSATTSTGVSQYLKFSQAVTGGTITFSFNSTNATTTSNGGTDTAAQVQTALRTIPALSTYGVTVVGDWTTGFVVQFPNVYTTLPLIGGSTGNLTPGVTLTVTQAQLVSYGQTGSPSPFTVHLQQGATNLGTITTDSMLVAGGAETAGRPRRLFIFTGVSQVAQISGGSSVVTTIGRPASDWLVNGFPTGATVYISRLTAWQGHTVYLSRQGDHTDFSTSETDGTGALQFSIFPGEGDGIISCVVFRGLLLVFKRPYGMYSFSWDGSYTYTTGSPVPNVSINKISDAFSIASPHAAAQIIDDLVAGSNSGSIFSQKASQALGGLEGGDILQQSLVRNYFRQLFNSSGYAKMQSVYYAEKLLGMFSGRINGSTSQNALLMYDRGGQSPRISVETKDQPTCLFMRKDSALVPRPFYGADDGYIYQMDQSVASVNGQAYTGEFTTPYADFSYLDPKLSEKVKVFDFLAVTYRNIGNWSFFVDVSVDGVFIQTLNFQMKQSASALDSFVLDQSPLGAPSSVLTLRKPLKSCAGKAISLRLYNSNANQSFTVERFIVSFREAGQQARSSKG